MTANAKTREQQFAYLQAMGIQAWQPRVAVVDEAQVGEILADEIQAEEVPAVDVPVVATSTNDGARKASRAALKEMLNKVSSPKVGVVPVTTASTDAAPAAAPSKMPVSIPVAKSSPVTESESPFMAGEEPPMPTDEYAQNLDMSEVGEDLAPAPVINVNNLDWPELQLAVSACTACELHQSRTQTVFGTGNHAAEWMIIGEAPKVDEDQQGQPFVGDSGQLLNNMLRALGLKREQVFISNILKCRPADDREPSSTEITQCEVYLQRQIALVAPKLILAVGGLAAHSLLKVKTPVTKLRGELHQYGETPLVVTYHPAYLLRKPSEKAKSWDDLKFAASVVRGEMKGEQS